MWVVKGPHGELSGDRVGASNPVCFGSLGTVGISVTTQGYGMTLLARWVVLEGSTGFFRFYPHHHGFHCPHQEAVRGPGVRGGLGLPA